MSDAPIGVFDSGVGGLTVARAIFDYLPREQVLYVGDTAHGPYGPLPIADVRRHALDVCDHLVDEGVKLLVIACNSASAACLRDARERYRVPVVEVILPATRQAVHITKTGRVGVIGTEATVKSLAYNDAFDANPGIRLTTTACPDFVDFVERGETNSSELLRVAEKYLEPLQEAGVDTLVLGCTHYPLLTGVISYVLGPGVSLVSSAEATALEAFRILADTQEFRDPALPAPQHVFRATGDPEPFARLARRFLGPEAGEVSRAALACS